MEKENNKVCIFLCLPKELITQHILEFIDDIDDLKNIRVTCMFFRNIIDYHLKLLWSITNFSQIDDIISNRSYKKIFKLKISNNYILTKVLKFTTLLEQLHLINFGMYKDVQLILPENLKCLYIHNFRDINDMDGFGITNNNNIISKLPLSLTQLEFTKCHWITNINALNNYTRLVSLKLINNNYITSKGLTYLPTSIKSLTLQACTEITSELFSNLPTNLKSLYINGCIKIKDVKVNHLSSLRSLNLSECYNINLSKYINFDFPSKLTDLDLSCNNQYITDELLISLPSTIKKLNLSDCDNITNQTLYKLTTNLTYLNVSNCHITKEGIEKLPDTITYLNISGCEYLIKYQKVCPNDSIVKMPSKLTHLNLSKLKLIKKNTLFGLPSSLTILQLNNCEKITRNGLKYLPQNLKHLELKYCFILHGRSLDFLPSTLTYLDLSSTFIKDNQIKKLPPSLTFLGLSFCGFEKKTISNLPKNLIHLKMEGYNNLSDDIINCFPKSLKFLSVSPSCAGDLEKLCSKSKIKIYISC